MTQSLMWQQIVFFALGPPIGAFLFFWVVRGLAITADGGDVRQGSRTRRRAEFWGVLILMYIMLGCVLLFSDFHS